MEINIYNFVPRHLADGSMKVIAVKKIKELDPKAYFINPHKPKELCQLVFTTQAFAKFENYFDFQSHMTTNVDQLVKEVVFC